ncbi:MAG: hypothetical protein IPP66_11590 [Anaerolineales bacterium]|nr:hypothetical protein [Anaerolineales bacterium]
MKCYVHESEEAVGICKHCVRAMCKQCAIPNDQNFMVCSERCKQEVLIYQDLMEKTKMAYGLKSGRLPATIIFLTLFGVLFMVFGCFAINTSLFLGIFTIVMGLAFLISGGVYYYNQVKSGLRT